MEDRSSSKNYPEEFLVTNWTPLQFNGSTIERLPCLSRFGSENLSEIMSSFNLPENTQITSSFPAEDFSSIIENASEKILEGKKRKKSPELLSNQSVESEQDKDVPTETATKIPMEKDKPKNGGSRSAKESGEVVKKDYIHIRARRGQATNSHSLAERVRREKISDRMRLLQDLVPGCNKITGKAAMLDEIINYVQSLQKLVEFLSMKLSTVNPDFSVNVEQMFTKDNLHSKFGYSPQLQSGMAIPALHNSRDFLTIATNPQISLITQISNPWGNEIQKAIQMGLIPNLSHDEMDLNGNGNPP